MKSLIKHLIQAFDHIFDSGLRSGFKPNLVSLQRNHMRIQDFWVYAKFISLITPFQSFPELIIGLTHLKYKIKHIRRCDGFNVLES